MWLLFQKLFCLCSKDRVIFRIRAVLLTAFVLGLCETQGLLDHNGDGVLSFVDIGDSIARGVGDQRGGFLQRLAYLLQRKFNHVNTTNLGIPGNRSIQVAKRIANIKSVNPDFVLILCGANDAWDKVSPEIYSSNIQKALNIAYFYGVEPVLITTPPTCCQRQNLYTFIQQYNAALRELAKLNQVLLVDVEIAFQKSCEDLQHCALISDGLHPSAFGYELIAELITAELLGIKVSDNLLNVRRQLSAKLSIPESELVVGRIY